MSLLLAEMVLASVGNFYSIRFVQIFLLLNVFCKNFKLFNIGPIFFVAIIQFIFYAVFFLSNEIILSELATIFWWLGFIGVLNATITNIELFEVFKTKLFKAFSWLATFSALLGIGKLYLLSRGVILPVMKEVLPSGEDIVIFGSSLNIDYNIYSIGLLFGVFSSIYCYRYVNTRSLKSFYSLSIIVQLFAAGFSSSRRGFLLAAFVFIVILFKYRSLMISNVKNHFQYSKYQFLYILIILSVVGMMFTNLNSIINASTEIVNLIDRLKTIETINSSANDLRSSRWSFALENFAQKDWLGKVFGTGFDYMKVFGNTFRDADLDHPHNVWVSSLLYGGIVGFILTIGLTMNTWSRYFFFRKELSFFYTFFLLFLFFNFTSSNSIFSSRLFMVIMLIPYLSIFNSKKIY